MNARPRFGIFLLLSLLAFWTPDSLRAQHAAPPPAALTPARTEDAAASVSEFDVNGMKVLFKRRAGSRTVAAGLFIRGGSANLTAETAGIEDLMLRAMVEGGSARFPRTTLRRELARMATAIGSGVNPDYSALTLACTRESFSRSWEIFADLFQRPALLPEDVERARERLLAALRSAEDAPDSALESLHERAIFSGHVYRFPPQGTPETLARLTAEDLRRHHRSLLAGTRLLLVVVGDLDAVQLAGRVGASFVNLSRGEYRPAAVPPLAFNAPAVNVLGRELPENYVRGAFTAPPLGSADFAAMHVAITLLKSRVFVEVRERRSLSYAPDAYVEKRGAAYGGIYVSAADANQAVRVMLGEIARMQREQVSQDDIEDAVAQWATSFYQTQETSAAQAGSLAQYELIGSGWRNAFSFSDQLARVTPADVQRVAQQYMRNIQFLVLGNPAQINREVFLGK
jgi:predicted Zn-dependent peptidase